MIIWKLGLLVGVIIMTDCRPSASKPALDTIEIISDYDHDSINTENAQGELELEDLPIPIDDDDYLQEEINTSDDADTPEKQSTTDDDKLYTIAFQDSLDATNHIDSDPRDLDVASNIVFRPLFVYRLQQRRRLQRRRQRSIHNVLVDSKNDLLYETDHDLISNANVVFLPLYRYTVRINDRKRLRRSIDSHPVEQQMTAEVTEANADDLIFVPDTFEQSLQGNTEENPEAATEVSESEIVLETTDNNPNDNLVEVKKIIDELKPEFTKGIPDEQSQNDSTTEGFFVVEPLEATVEYPDTLETAESSVVHPLFLYRYRVAYYKKLRERQRNRRQ